ncbi:hypothetical protein [Kitasatospora sp. NPDC057198]|uniref:hypothetical protein n=1 Tax=Kitasatospora sp. NPDC057198 TaxID=3346046 RepID=UPI00362AECC8
MKLLPAVVPTALFDQHGLDREKHEWGYDVLHAAAAPDGGTYALAVLWRHESSFRPDPTGPSFRHQLIVRYAPDGTPLTIAPLREPRSDDTATAAHPHGHRLAVLRDGTPVLTTRNGGTYVLSPELDEVRTAWPIASYATWSDRDPDADPFAASIAVTPNGRLLCATGEYGVQQWGGVMLNLVSVSGPDAVLAPGRKPELRALACLVDEIREQKPTDLVFPHVRHRGEPVFGGNRPLPSLVEALDELTGTADDLHRHRDGFLHYPAALGDDLFVVPVYGRTFRSGSRGQQFSFALLDDTGAVRGRLGGLDLRADSPFTGQDYTVVGDPYRGRAFHLNRYGLYAWTADGELRARLSLDDKPFKPLRHFALHGCSPDGELLLGHRKQHLLMRVPVPDELSALPAAVESAFAGLARARNALKKRHAPVDRAWADDTTPVRHL